jgi:hypothetical protein
MTKGRNKQDSFDIVRKRMLHETEVALLYGMSFPDRVRRIPRIEVGKGEFSRQFSDAFWREAVGLDYGTGPR